MKGWGPGETERRKGDCPGAGVWRAIAGGLTSPDKTLACLEHASRCDHCGPLLREVVAELADLNGEITEAELNLIAVLDSARAEWQQRLARQITGTQHSAADRESKPWWRRWLAVPSSTVPRLAMAGASLLAIVAVGSWGIGHAINKLKANP